MRFRFLTIAIAAVLAAGLLASLGLAAPPRLLQAQSSAIPVDTELVLAVDVSYSMDPEEQQIQREGYVEAITSREFMAAIRAGSHGKIALTYFEWAGADDQTIIVPWRLIEGPETADAFGAEITRAPYRRASRTSIGGALMFAKPLFAASGFRGLRRVVDVSGDGPNNSGPLVLPQRDDLVTAGITINGLPLTLNRPNSFSMDIANLDVYYEDCVIGGPGAFVIPVRNREQFKEAIRTKLIMEVAEPAPAARVQRVQARQPRISCTVGEQMWRDRWGN
ncbi:MAG: DUF1194 domain-containing protein [Rhizobiales bacterium]|nr:DUF1194 domain-containing protein [Hyphomicrobiales bacterium]